MGKEILSAIVLLLLGMGALVLHSIAMNKLTSKAERKLPF